MKTIPTHSFTRQMIPAIFAMMLSGAGSAIAFNGGDGSPGNPYQVATAADLNDVRDHLGAHFVQTADIDLGDPAWSSGEGWLPIGTARVGIIDANYAPFTGTYDGGGFEISNLTLNRQTSDIQGLFGVTDSAVVRNVRLVGVSLTARRYSGALVGSARESLVEFVSASGSISGSSDRIGGLIGSAESSLVQVAVTDMTVSGGDRTGGLVGYNNGEIHYSSSQGSVTGASSTGGLVGYHHAPGLVTDCFSHANVSGSSAVGGFAGAAWNSTSMIRRCFSTGTVAGSGSNIGGFLGQRANSAQVDHAYWNVQSSGLTESAMGEGKTTAEMRQAATFPAFDFGIAWAIDEGVGYATLDAVSYNPAAPPEILPENLPGSGTAGDPYLISTPAELNAMRRDLAAHYRLNADIDLSNTIVWNGGRGWEPVGYSRVGTTTGRQPFTGSLDGAGHTLSNLSLNRPATEVQGLFGYVEGAVLRNLSVTDAAIHAGRYSGILAGYLVSSDVEFVRVSGLLTGPGVRLGGIAGSANGSRIQMAEAEMTIVGQNEAGALVGYNNGEIRYSSATGSVTGASSTGGFVGFHHAPGIIADCFSHAAASGATAVGGFAGGAWNSTSMITRCFSTGAVTGGESNVGGFLGQRANSAQVYHCYWDTESSLQNTSAMGTGKTTAGMRQSATFPAFDFHIAWSLTEGVTYPALAAAAYDPGPPAEILPSELPGSGTVNNPYQIATAAQLNAMRGDLAAHYRLTADIDLANTIVWDLGRGWEPVGYSLVGTTAGRQAFTGSLDGAGHVISNLTLNRPANEVQGLFGYTEDALIHNLSITNAAINAKRYAGVLAGQTVASHTGFIHTSGLLVTNPAERAGGMTGSAHTGTILASQSTTRVLGGNESGGLVGWNDGEIRYSRTSGAVTGAETVGGLVGYHRDPGLITDCLSDSPVHGTSRVGGLVGAAWNSNCQLMHSFSVGPVTGTGSDLGGLLGYRANSADVHYCYWDTGRSGQTESAMGEGKTTAEMRQAESFPTYHFGRIWTIEEGVSDPALVEFAALSPYQPALVMPADLPGAGTPENPYRIATATELHAMRHDLAAHYRLVADIDLTDSALWDAGRGWNPVGYSRVGTSAGRQAFTGSLDGAGHTIAHLAINRPALEVAGLFGYAEGAKIRNLRVTAAVARAGRYSGIIAGQLVNSIAENLSVAAEINSTGNRLGGAVGFQSGGSATGLVVSAVVIGANEAGGVAGYQTGEIHRSSASGHVTGNTAVGGFSGVISSPGVALDSFSHATVTGADRVGGFAGEMWSGGLRAARCYSAGAVVSDGTWVGGFVAYPANSPTVSFCYWDTQASRIATDPLAASRMTAEMTHPHASNTYEEWDFATVWNSDTSGSNAGYPLPRDSEVPLDWYLTHGIAPAEGQTWADLDRIDWLGKGMTLHEEFLAGTDPADPQSRFAATPPAAEGTGIEIHFQPSLPERRYTLFRTTDLSDWIVVPGMQNVPGGNGPLIDAEPPEGSAFYRIEVSLP